MLQTILIALSWGTVAGLTEFFAVYYYLDRAKHKGVYLAGLLATNLPAFILSIYTANYIGIVQVTGILIVVWIILYSGMISLGLHVAEHINLMDADREKDWRIRGLDVTQKQA